jgi:GxxExxY protein
MDPHATDPRWQRVNEITGLIVTVAFAIHSRLGPGLLERVYETVLARDLERRGLQVARQVPVSFEFEGLWFENAFRADLLVERQVIVEVKAVAALTPIFERQLLTYVRLMDCPAGLLLNFGTAMMRDGIRRVVHRF